MSPTSPAQLIDGFDRRISYLRLSVTDRCDFRCQYCMAETMEFLPRAQVLTIEELVRTARLFTELGVRKIRVTGGEPLIRRGVDRCSEPWQSARFGDTRPDHQRQPACCTSTPAPRGWRQLSQYQLDSLDPSRFHPIADRPPRCGSKRH